jgi:hypothetical protein
MVTGGRLVALSPLPQMVVAIVPPKGAMVMTFVLFSGEHLMRTIVSISGSPVLYSTYCLHFVHAYLHFVHRTLHFVHPTLHFVHGGIDLEHFPKQR